MELEPAADPIPEEDDVDELGELFVLCCPQDREFAKRTLLGRLGRLGRLLQLKEMIDLHFHFQVYSL